MEEEEVDGGFILFRLVVFHCAFLRNHFCFTKEEGSGGGFSLYHCFTNFTWSLIKKNYLGIFVRSKCIINGSAGFLLCPCSGKPC